MKKFSLLLILLGMAFAGRAQEAPKNLHFEWNRMLKSYVDEEGGVNYKGWKKEQEALRGYLKAMGQMETEGFTENDVLAYYINIYNAATVDLILTHYPLESIKDIEIDGNSAWEHPFILLNEKAITLNHLENEIIRKQFNDPKIHFALVCAAKSCPKLHNRAFTGENLNEVLTTLTTEFINNAEANTIQEDLLVVSRIFEWYSEDFGGKEGVIPFVRKHTNKKIGKNPTLRFQDYDWSLNTPE